MPRRADPERTAWGRTAQVSLVHIVLKGAEEHVGDAFRNRNKAQGAVVRPLACQRRPTLKGAEHTAYRRRRNLLGFQPVGSIERVITVPVAGEDVLVYLLIARVDPALYSASIHMGRKSKGLVPGLPPAH